VFVCEGEKEKGNKGNMSSIGVASGPNGNYYAILRSDSLNAPPPQHSHNFYHNTDSKSFDYSDEASSDTL
jgi:hypothetical protein